MTEHNRDSLERWAKRLGYELSEADSRLRMEAASNYNPRPRYQLSPKGSQWASEVRGYESLARVSQALDEIGIMADKQDLAPQKREVDPKKLAAAWSSTQPTKDNLVAAKPAQAPALNTGRRQRF